MGKLEDNKKQKEEALYKTAFNLFTSKGFHKTSISEIVNMAGVAKGTFYLYFKDKYDVRNKLISYHSSKLFAKAYEELLQTDLTDFSDKLIFIVDKIINQLTDNTVLLKFIAKNLSWGVFKNSLLHPSIQSETDFLEVYMSLIKESPLNFKDPELMLFMIVELISSCCYNSILTSEPVGINELKPYLYETIKAIIQQHTETII